MRTAPFGSWESPIRAADLTAPGVIRLSEPRLDGDDLYWLEGRPDEGGRVTVCRWRSGAVEEVTPGWNVRSRVHEYGGGAYAVRDGVVVFSDFASGRVFVLRGGAAVPLTGEGPFRYGDLRVHPDRGLVLAVREDHSGPDEPVNTLVTIGLDGDASSPGTVLVSGADFYAAPELSADGRLAWIEWNHPAMPWDATRLCVAPFDDLTGVEVVAGGPGESAVSPFWLADGRLLFATDRGGFWTPWVQDAEGVRPLAEQPHDFVRPLWVLGERWFAQDEPGSVLCAPIIEGRSTAHRLDLATGGLTDLGWGWADVGGVVANQAQTAWLAGFDDRPTALMAAESGQPLVEVRFEAPTRLDPALVSVAEPVSWESPLGSVHGWFYPPRNRQCAAPEGERPPLIVLSHGGPTAYAAPTFSLAFQFWTSRGIGILDVNYGGSSGYGRAYRDRLVGRWGVVDVADCVEGARSVADRGLADVQRLAIKGGSAGGFTTLAALTSSRVFGAGISRYGIGDLTALASDTHKFESRYLDGLVGPWPEAEQVYRERSPINRIDALNCPMLLLQGADDKVVPPNQAEAMAAAVTAKGLPVDLIVFEGEGHGFRKAETIQAATTAELAFLGRVFGFSPRTRARLNPG